MPPRRTPRGGWDALTPAELRVAELVAEGLTNPQIATRLFVSRHTVQTQLRNVFRKLGLSSRAQLAVQVVLRGTSRAARPAPEGGRVVRSGPGFALGVFRCRPEDPRWTEENWIGDGYHVVFPRTAVSISRSDGEVMADPNVAVLYDAGETYRRSLVDPRGDYCSYAAVSAELLEEMAGRRGGRRPHFPRPAVPVDARIYALQWTTIATLTGVYDRDRLATDEEIMALLGVVVRSAFDAPLERPRDPGGIVTKAKRVLAERLADPLTVADVAGELPVSPYHLIRLFRRETGMTLHLYRTHLRLRSSLDRLVRRDEPIAAIATSLGFSSHSHFTERFTRVFGITPTDLRASSSPASRLCGVLGLRG